MKHIFIVNPISGAGRGKKIGENIERVAPELGLDYEVFILLGDMRLLKLLKNIRRNKILFIALVEMELYLKC